MPLYDYHCISCGPFEASRPMKDSSESVACPQCHAPTGRVLVAPRLNLMQPSTRKAELRNEKSAHEPEVAHRAAPDGSHGGGPHHHDAHDHKRHKPARPWMVGH